MRVGLTVIALLLFVSMKIYGQEADKIVNANALMSVYKEATGEVSMRTSALDMSKNENAYGFMALREYLGTLNIIIEKTGDMEAIAEQVALIDNLTSSSQTSRRIQNNVYSHQDRYKGWVVTKANKANESTIGNEVPLFESYSFFYVAQFLHLVKENGWRNKSLKNRLWWHSKVRFLEKNIWEKWRVRSYKDYGVYNRYFLRNRTHMGAHWAGIAMYLNALTNNSSIKQQTREVKDQYDQLLKHNLQTKNQAYLWASTYDNPKGTDATRPSESVIQDVPHSNHVVSYIIAAYEFGDPNWTREDVSLLGNTFKKILYQPSDNRLADYVDGQIQQGRLNWEANISDGWMKLIPYDSEVSQIFNSFKSENKLRKGVQEWTYDILTKINEDPSHH